MKEPSRHFAALLLCVIFAALAAFAQQGFERVTPADYAADDKCLSCHRDQKTYRATAHYLTSTPPSKDSIAGKFREGENILKTSNPDLIYRMEATKDGYYQTAVLGTPPDTASLSKRFDFVIGSERKGQTYLYWESDRLFQLPVSYWTEVRKQAFMRSSVGLGLGILASMSTFIALFNMTDAEFSALDWTALSARKAELSPYINQITLLSLVWTWSEVIVLLFNRKRRALHDFIAATVVIEHSQPMQRFPSADKGTISMS